MTSHHSDNMYSPLLSHLKRSYDQVISDLLGDHRTRTKMLELRAQEQLKASIFMQLEELSDPGVHAYLYPIARARSPRAPTPRTVKSQCADLFWQFTTPGVPAPDYDYDSVACDRLDALSELWEEAEAGVHPFGEVPDLEIWRAFVREWITRHLDEFVEGSLPRWMPEALRAISERRMRLQGPNKSWPQEWDHCDYAITISSDVPHDMVGMSRMPYWYPGSSGQDLYVLLHTDTLIFQEPPSEEDGERPAPRSARLCVGFIHLCRPKDTPSSTPVLYDFRAIAIAEPVRGHRWSSRLLQAAVDHLHRVHPEGWSLQRSRPGADTPQWFTQNMTDKLAAAGAVRILPASA